jgi:hypothetical protein
VGRAGSVEDLRLVERGLNALGENFPRVASAARDLAEGLQNFARESLGNIANALGQAGSSWRASWATWAPRFRPA